MSSLIFPCSSHLSGFYFGWYQTSKSCQVYGLRESVCMRSFWSQLQESYDYCCFACILSCSKRVILIALDFGADSCSMHQEVRANYSSQLISDLQEQSKIDLQNHYLAFALNCCFPTVLAPALLIFCSCSRCCCSNCCSGLWPICLTCL